jgi:hypothetical protein
MRRRSHRWNSLISPARYEGPFTRPARTGRIRWLTRTGALLAFIVLRDVLTRWWPVAAGVVLTVAGFILRSGPGSVILLSGLLLLVSAPFVLPSLKEDPTRRRKLERELAAYSTPAQRRDLEVILDRYPDSITRELREMLSTQARAGGKSQVPGGRRY